MEQYQDIFIYCANGEDIPVLFAQVRGQIESSPNWAIDEEGMGTATSENLYGGKEFLDADYLDANGEKVAMLVVLHDGAGKVYVPNIIPRQKNSLTEAEYNEILAAFDRDVLSPAVGRWGREHRREETKGQISVDDVFPEPLARLLRVFSKLANKSTLHPLDDERWREFLIATHRSGAQVHAETLRTLLVEELDWPEEQATKLAGEYYNGLELLEAYDESR
jgi:hypothetical protein